VDGGKGGQEPSRLGGGLRRAPLRGQQGPAQRDGLVEESRP
jgi:hypothetical protein